MTILTRRMAANQQQKLPLAEPVVDHKVSPQKLTLNSLNDMKRRRLMNTQNQKTILLVEDEATIAMRTARVLKSFGYEVVTTHSGEDAVKLAAETNSISLILMDINLGGGMDGTEAAKQILTGRHLPILFLISHTEEDVARVKEITRYGYVLKNSGNFVLKSSIEMAFELFKQYEKTRQSEEKYRTLLHNIEAGVVVHNPDTRIVTCNPKAQELLGLSQAQMLGRTANEARYKNLLQSISDSVYVLDKNWRTVMVNDVAEKFTGLSKEKLLNTSLLDLFPGVEDTAFFKVFQAVMEQRKPDVVIDEFNFPDGRKGWYEVNVYPVSEGILCISRDITERKLAEKALRQSEQKYRNLFESANDAIFVADGETGLILDANMKAEKLTGRPKEKIIGMHQTQLHPDFQEEPARESFKDDVKRGERTVYREFQVVHQNGHTIPVEISPNIIDIDGRPCVYGIFRDISERKRMEEALQESLQEIEIITASIPNIIWKTDIDEKRDFVNTYISKAVDEFLELPPNTINHSWDKYFGYVKPQYMPTILEAFNFAADHPGEIVSCEYEVVKANGETAWFSSDGRVYIEDNAIKAYGFTTDITERKRAEIALAESENRYRSIFQNGHVVMLVIDPETGAIRDANPAAVGFYGWSYEALTGMKIQEINTLSRAEVQAEMEAACRMHRNFFQFRHRLKDGNIREVHVGSGPIEYDGNPLLFSIIQDVTDQKRAEAALRKSEKALREANATKDKFFGIIAHDLKNPAFAVESGARLLKNRLREADDQYTQQISVELHNRAQQLYKLLENLLTWSRLQRGEISCTPTDVELYSAVMYVWKLVQQSASHKLISWACPIDEQLIVYADYNMLQFILRNLITNSIKFTKEGGKITVDATDNGAVVEISVIDTGVGIPESKRQRLFHIGERKISSKGTAGEKGTGLGLILCKEFVEKQGGQIWVESEEGQGSTVKFTLPKADIRRLRPHKRHR